VLAPTRADYSHQPPQTFAAAHSLAPNGQAFRFPAWSIERILMSLVVRRGIYRGVRDNRPLS
jgi:hypothetical protein